MKIILKAILMYFAALIVTGLMLFLPAGSFDYWQAWIFIAVLFVPVTFVIVYFLKHDTGLLERRIQFKEKELKQKNIIKIAQIMLFIGVIVAGLDFRFSLSQVPLWLVIFADIIIFLAYILIFFVFKENSYTSRIVEVSKNQKLVDTGLYSIIRHPMYAGVIPMYIAIPFALGSYYALIFFIPIIIVILLRIKNEEEVLEKKLKGYKEYMKKVKYRLIPGIY